MNDPTDKAVPLAQRKERRLLQEKSCRNIWSRFTFPDDFDPSFQDEAVRRDISALNVEMLDAGVRILDAADLDGAVAWGRKAIVACRAPVEVREFHRIRPDVSK